MNAFQYDYETRLQQWNQLRSSVHDLTTLNKCTQIYMSVLVQHKTKTKIGEK